MRLDEGFERERVRWFERLFGVALLVEVATQATSGVWRVHAGASYPWRHLGVVPLERPAFLVVEWLTVVACAMLVILDRRRRAAWRVLAAALLWGVLQRFSNHGALFFMIALFVAFDPPDTTAEDFESREHVNLGLVRAQIVIVYVFSALAKLLHGFTSGASLANLFGVAPGLARAGSWVVIAGELALAALVVKRPRAGVVGIVMMHAVFAALLPNVLSFGVCMLAMAMLWLPVSPERGGPSPSPSDRAASDAPPQPPRT